MSPAYLEPNKFWPDCRLTVYGTHGYAWAETDGWGTENLHLIQTAYTRDFANWLDDPTQSHPCNLDITRHGFEIANAIVLSAMDHTRIDLPLIEDADARMIDRLKNELPVLATFSVPGYL